jgi:threonine dehydrogenase-like Zn-dependent dehydrogenase
MEFIAVVKGKEGPQLLQGPDPKPGPAEGLLRTLEVGIDGTDEEIIAGGYGEFPPGDDFMVLGHEALARVEVAPPGGDVVEGDLVVPTVRRGCGICTPCKTGRSDFCQTGLYRERGIRGLHGYMAAAFTERQEYLAKVPREIAPVAILTEPLSIAEKALEQALWVQARLPWACSLHPLRDKRVLVVGAGTLGILTGLLCRHAGARTLVADRQADDAPRSQVIRRLGLEHVNSREVDLGQKAAEEGGFDLIVEATGAPQVPFGLLPSLAINGTLVMLGVPAPAGAIPVEAAAIMRGMVLKNQALVGSVNSNLAHFRLALDHLRELRGELDGGLEALITHRMPYHRFREAFALRDSPGAIKRVLTFSP